MSFEVIIRISARGDRSRLEGTRTCGILNFPRLTFLLTEGEEERPIEGSPSVAASARLGIHLMKRLTIAECLRISLHGLRKNTRA